MMATWYTDGVYYVAFLFYKDRMKSEYLRLAVKVRLLHGITFSYLD